MTATVLILAHATDSGAESVAAHFAHNFGSRAVRIIRPEMLSLARWSHRVDSRGRAATRLTLPRSEPIDDAGVGAVLNRIRYLPSLRFQRASAKDQDYAGAELQALVASWLAALDRRVVHVVREHPWVTPVLPPQHWAKAAAEAGLPVATRIISSSPRALRYRSGHAPGKHRQGDAASHPAASDGTVPTVLVAGDRVGGLLSAGFGPQCLQAAHLLRFPLLEFRFATEEGSTVLVEVDPLPPLVEPWAAALTAGLLESLAAEPQP